MKERKTLRQIALILPVAAYLFFAYLFPLYSIFKQSVTFGNSDFAINRQLLQKTLLFTFKEAILSTLFTMILGLACAYVFSCCKFKGKRIIMAILSVPFMLPTVVVAAGMNALLGPKGWLNSLLMDLFSLKTAPIHAMNTFGIIIFAHVFYNTSLVIRVVSNAWMLIDQNIISAAETLGGNFRQVFAKIIFPLLKPGILSAALLVFLFDFTSYGVVLLMGGPKYKTLEVEISYQTLQVFDLKTAGVLSLIQLLITLIIVVTEQMVRRKSIRVNKIKVYDENQKAVKSAKDRLIVWGITGVMLLITVLPLFSLVFRSFYVPRTDLNASSRNAGFSLVYYKNLFTNTRNSYFFVYPAKAILYSIENAAACSLIAVIFGAMICVLAKRSNGWRFLNVLVLLPIGTSAVTLGLGYLITYRKALTSSWITPLAHSIVVLPFVIRTLQPAIEFLPESLGQSASVLGANPLQVLLKIKIPVLRRAILNSLIFSFTISMGEFGATSFLTRPERPTMPVAIYNFLSKPGGLNYGSAMAMSTILLVFSVVCIYLMSDR